MGEYIGSLGNSKYYLVKLNKNQLILFVFLCVCDRKRVVDVLELRRL